MIVVALIEDDCYVESKVVKRASTLIQATTIPPLVQFIDVKRHNSMFSNDQVSATK